MAGTLLLPAILSGSSSRISPPSSRPILRLPHEKSASIFLVMNGNRRKQTFLPFYYSSYFLGKYSTVTKVYRIGQWESLGKISPDFFNIWFFVFFLYCWLGRDTFVHRKHKRTTSLIRSLRDASNLLSPNRRPNSYPSFRVAFRIRASLDRSGHVITLPLSS